MSINIEEFKDLTAKEIEEKIESLTDEEIDSLTREDRKAISDLKRIKEKQEAKVKIPKLKARGEKLIYPERKEEWKKHVETFSDGKFLFALKDTLKVMEALTADRPMDELYKEVSDTDSLMYCYGAIITFSKRGPEFGRSFAEKWGLTGEIKERINEIEAENKIFAENEKSRKVATATTAATISTETTAEPIETKNNNKE